MICALARNVLKCELFVLKTRLFGETAPARTDCESRTDLPSQTPERACKKGVSVMETFHVG